MRLASRKMRISRNAIHESRALSRAKSEDCFSGGQVKLKIHGGCGYQESLRPTKSMHQLNTLCQVTQRPLNLKLSSTLIHPKRPLLTFQYKKGQVLSWTFEHSRSRFLTPCAQMIRGRAAKILRRTLLKENGSFSGRAECYQGQASLEKVRKVPNNFF